MKCLFVIVMLFAGTAAGCRRDPAPPPKGDLVPAVAEKIRNVLLVSVDTVRADHFGCYGYEGKITPTIDALAGEGVLFEKVISPAPMTLPAHCSLLTGTNPTRHGVRQNIKYRLGPSHVTLAELLRAQGFTTGAFVASHVLDEEFGIGQGFEEFDDQFQGMERSADQISTLANQWIEAHLADRFFLWLHYFDPHAPFDPPDSYAEPFKSTPHSRYAGEIAYVDASFASVLQKLRDLELYDSTLIVLVGDHGEALGDHGEQFHSFFIYQSTIQTPWIMKIPGVPGARRIPEQVSLVDVVPTVCGLLQLPPQDTVEGEDLGARCVGTTDSEPERAIYCESLTPTVYGCNPLLGLVTRNWKLIQTTRAELYDLQQDPQELNNIAEAHPDTLAELELQLEDFIVESLQVPAEGDNVAQVDEQTIRQLQSLGYVGGTVDEEFTLDQSKPDPKDLIEYHRNYMQVGDLMRRERFEDAQQLCLAMIKQQPRIYCGYSSLADIAMIAGKFPVVINLSKRALELNQEDVDSHFRLGVALHMTGKLGEAIAQYRATLELNPDKADAHLNLGKALQTEGNLTEAIEHYREALRIDPDNPAIRQQLSAAQKQLAE